MKAFIKSTLSTGIPFGIPFGLMAGVLIGIFEGFSQGLKYGVTVAVGTGLAFGLAMATFMTFQLRTFAQQRQEFTGEELLHDGPANHLLNGEGVGGWLFLTDKRLVFRSHGFNMQVYELSVPLSEVVEVQAVWTARIIPNGLRVVSNSGQPDEFIVEGHRRWRDQIVAAKERAV